MSAYLPYTSRVRSLLAALDAAALLAALGLAYVLRFDGSLLATKLEELWGSYGLVLWSLLSAWIVTVAAELHEPEVLHRRRETVVRVLVAVVVWSVGIVVATYLRPSWAFGRGLLALTGIFLFVLMVFVRWAMRSRLRRRARFPALVVGEAEAVERFCRELTSRPSSPWKPVAGSGQSLEDIREEVRARNASIVVMTGGDDTSTESLKALSAMHFSGVPVVSASEIWAWLEERLPLEALSPALFLHQPGFGAVHWTLFNRMTRILDVVLTTLLIIPAAPIYLLAALLVMLLDGRPVLYRQQRVGQFGRLFTMYKLRTMARDAESKGPEFASHRDPRITPFGRFLRRFRIDELPQLLNILEGEMSLVGPRPERPEFVAQLSREIPYYPFRLSVPPGLTGWAQVNTPYASDLDDHRRKLEFDLYFIRERSIRLYLMTLLRTLSAALAGTRGKR